LILGYIQTLKNSDQFNWYGERIFSCTVNQQFLNTALKSSELESYKGSPFKGTISNVYFADDVTDIPSSAFNGKYINNFVLNVSHIHLNEGLKKLELVHLLVLVYKS
jgi:hypothetical protein